MAKLVLEIPEQVQTALRLPPPELERELRAELAVALYRRGALSFGKARQLAGLSRWGFGQRLGEDGVVRHYSADDLAEDLEYAGVR